MKKIVFTFSAMTALSLLAACATSADPEKTLAASSQVDDSKPTAIDVMRSGGTYEFAKPTEPIYANSSAELAEKYVGRHVDELPEAVSSSKAVQDPNEVVCQVVKRTHTRLRAKKVCAPRKEWDAYKSAAKDVLRTKQITRRSGD